MAELLEDIRADDSAGAPTITMRSKASSLIERTNRSPCALRLGLRGGKTTGSTPLALSKASNACVNFVSRSWSRYRLPRRNPSKGSVSCRAQCCRKAAVGCVVMPATCTRRVASSITTSTSYVTRPCHVATSTVKKSVAASTSPVELEELRPAHTRPAALRGGLQVVATQDVPHRDRVNRIPQMRQGALDAAIAPAGGLRPPGAGVPCR